MTTEDKLDIKIPDTVPLDWTEPKKEESDDDEKKWRIQFKWKKKTWTSDYTSMSHARSIYELWQSRPKKGNLELRAPREVYFIPWRQIKNMRIIA